RVVGMVRVTRNERLLQILPCQSRRLAVGLDGSPTHLETARITIQCMPSSSFGRAGWRVIVIQVLILSALVAFYELYLPHRARELAGRATATREEKINALFQAAVL